MSCACNNPSCVNVRLAHKSIAIRPLLIAIVVVVDQYAYELMAMLICALVAHEMMY